MRGNRHRGPHPRRGGATTEICVSTWIAPHQRSRVRVTHSTVKLTHPLGLRRPTNDLVTVAELWADAAATRRLRSRRGHPHRRSTLAGSRHALGAPRERRLVGGATRVRSTRRSTGARLRPRPLRRATGADCRTDRRRRAARQHAGAGRAAPRQRLTDQGSRPREGPVPTLADLRALLSAFPAAIAGRRAAACARG